MRGSRSPPPGHGLPRPPLFARGKQLLSNASRGQRLDGYGAREVARLLGLSPNTERRYREALAAAGMLQGAPEAIPALEELKAALLKHSPPTVPHQQQSSLECCWERIVKRHEDGLGPTAICDPAKRGSGLSRQH